MYKPSGGVSRDSVHGSQLLRSHLIHVSNIFHLMHSSRVSPITCCDIFIILALGSLNFNIIFWEYAWIM